MVIEKGMLTPPQVAKRWGVAADKVLQLIHSNQLIAVNLAVDPKGRPRYRLHLADIERFEQARSNNPAIEPPQRRRRRRAASAGKEYF